MDKVLYYVFGTLALLSLFGVFGCIYTAIWTDIDAKMVEETGLTTLLFGVVSFIAMCIFAPEEKRKL